MSFTLPNILVLFHAHCHDGLAAAWVIRKALGKENVDLIPVSYDTPPPDTTGRHVIIVDFSYPLVTLREMMKTTLSILILDHHKTAQEELRLLGRAPDWKAWMDHILYPRASDDTSPIGHDGCVALFDMNRSGVRIAWDYFFPTEAMPLLFEYIEDRDLWRKPGMQDRNMIHLGIASYPLDFAIWDALVGFNIAHLRSDGAAIQRKWQLDIEKIIAETKRPMLICGYVVSVVNIPHGMAADAGEMLSKGMPFSASYYDTATSRNFSLRSSSDGIDVSEIARHYKGGGHFHAAGFKTVLGWEGDPNE